MCMCVGVLSRGGRRRPGTRAQKVLCLIGELRRQLVSWNHLLEVLRSARGTVFLAAASRIVGAT